MDVSTLYRFLIGYKSGIHELMLYFLTYVTLIQICVWITDAHMAVHMMPLLILLFVAVLKATLLMPMKGLAWV